MGCPTLPISLNLQFLLLFSLLFFKVILLTFVEPGVLHWGVHKTPGAATPLSSPLQLKSGVWMLLQPSQKTANPWKEMCAERQQAREPPESFTDMDYRNSWCGVRNQTAFTDLILCWGLGVTSGMAARKIPLPNGMETCGCEQGWPPTKIRVCGVVFKPPHSSRLPVQCCSSQTWSWDLPHRGQGQHGDCPRCHQACKSPGTISVPVMNPPGTGSPAALPHPCNREKIWNVFLSLFKGKRTFV